MRHRAAPGYWACYHSLPVNVQRAADKAFLLLKADRPIHRCASRNLAGFGLLVLVLPTRALGIQVQDGVLWFWMGSHADWYCPKICVEAFFQGSSKRFVSLSDGCIASLSTRRDLKALHRLIHQAYLVLATISGPHPSIASARESLDAALALSSICQTENRMPPLSDRRAAGSRRNGDRTWEIAEILA